MLIDFGGKESLRILPSEYVDQIKYIASLAKEQLVLTALFVRPDGVVAWGSDGEVNVKSVRDAIARWFTAKS